MLLNYEDVSSVKKMVEVEIPADLISAESQRVTTDFSRQAKIPGFRPGKVPAGIVRTRFAKEIQEQVMERLLPRTGITETDLVVLDPPRSGAGRDTVRHLAGLTPRRIAYVACDPAALARDLAFFAAVGYRPVSLRAFDLFPMTQHFECVAILEPVSS